MFHIFKWLATPWMIGIRFLAWTKIFSSPPLWPDWMKTVLLSLVATADHFCGRGGAGIWAQYLPPYHTEIVTSTIATTYKMRCLTTESNLRVRSTLFFIAEIILHGKDFGKFNIKQR